MTPPVPLPIGVLAALLAGRVALAAQDDPLADAAAPALADLLAHEIVAQDQAVSVALVSAEDEPERLDVISHGAPAHEVLHRVAKATGRELKLDPGETALRANWSVDVNLRKRPLREAVAWIAGAAGLAAEVSRTDVRCWADVRETVAPEQLLERAIESWRLALLRDPMHPDAHRLRFAIGNAWWQLGDFLQAIQAYEELQRITDGFGDLPLAYFRCGHAYARLGDEPAAQAQWLAIAQLFPRSPLVAAARLEAVRSLRRQGDTATANTIMRLVVEGMRDGLTPLDLLEAGELLHEGGNHDRAISALAWALQSTTDPDLEERGLVAMARAHSGRRDWPDVVATSERYLDKHPGGRNAAEVYLLLGTAHAGIDDAFTALLAVARARELATTPQVRFHCDLLEGQIYAGCGMVERAEPSLSRAGACEFPEIAAPALAAHARLLRDHGRFEMAASLGDRLRLLPGHETEAAVLLAEIYLLQRNRTRCVELIHATLSQADAGQRATLLELAARALHEAPDVAGLLLGAEGVTPGAGSDGPADRGATNDGN